MKTLIVDDDAEMRLLLGEVLRLRGHEVTVCADAEAAWESCQCEVYPLVLLDWLLPGMDGVQLCRQLRALPHGDRSVILMVTGRDQAEDLQAVLEAGADDYLAKPFNIALLDVRLTVAERQVQALMERKQAEEALAAAREHEVEIGSRIQQTLLQGHPPRDLPGVNVAALTIPSQKIDGDFYGFFCYQNQHLDVLIGDVMGKGVPAALLGAATKSQFLHAINLLMASSASAPPSPVQIVTLVHAEVTPQLIDLESFITVCYVRFDLAKQCLDFVDCGHTRIIHCQPDTRACQTLQGMNMPLGFSAEEVYEQVTAPFGTGDVFVLYSDGVTEAQDEEGAFFGEERLMACVQRYSTLAADALLEKLCEAVHAFTQAPHIADDFTCVVVKIAPQETPPPVAVLDITSKLTELARLRTFVRQVCQSLPSGALHEDSTNQLILAVNEAASNIMRHAYDGHTDQRIQVQAEVRTDRLALSLYHWGKVFVPEDVPAPAFDGSRDGGFGVYIIAQSVDEVQYLHDEQGRRGVCLVKYL